MVLLVITTLHSTPCFGKVIAEISDCNKIRKPSFSWVNVFCHFSYVNFLENHDGEVSNVRPPWHPFSLLNHVHLSHKNHNVHLDNGKLAKNIWGIKRAVLKKSCVPYFHLKSLTTRKNNFNEHLATQSIIHNQSILVISSQVLWTQAVHGLHYYYTVTVCAICFFEFVFAVHKQRRHRTYHKLMFSSFKVRFVHQLERQVWCLLSGTLKVV